MFVGIGNVVKTIMELGLKQKFLTDLLIAFNSVKSV